MGFVTNMLSAGMTARGYDARKNQTLAHGQAAKNRAYSQATGVEQAARANALVEGANMMTMRGNQRRAVGGARAQAAGSGFTSEGTGAATADAVSGLYGKQISDMAYESSTGSINTVNQAVGLRRQGDEYMRAAEAEAAQYRYMAKGTRTGMWVSGFSGTIGGITGGIQAYNEAKKHNAQAAEFNASQEVQGGLMKPTEMKNLTGSSIMGALDGADAWSSATNAMNPYMSSFTTQGWEKNFLKSLGYGQK